MKEDKRIIEDKTLLDTFVEEFCSVIEKHVKYIVCSGFVAIAHGRTRGTEDIDMIIEKITQQTFKEMHQDLNNHGFVCIQSDAPEEIYNQYLMQGNSVRYVRDEEGFFPPEMEVKFVKDELDQEQINERMKLPLTKLNVYFSSIESNIAFKEEYLKSEKDLEDAKHLRIIYESMLDEGKIKEIKEKIRSIRLKHER